MCVIQSEHMQNKFKIIDESGDRNYFTIVPNYIVNHSTPYEQAIYLYMKRRAGETGTCWSSAQEIAKHLSISRNTVSRYREKLVKRGWIKVVGYKGKTKPTPEYRVVDIWKLNVDHYKKESSLREQSFNRVVKEMEKVQDVNLVSSSVVHKEEPLKKNQYFSKEKQSKALVSYGNKDINDLIFLLMQRGEIKKLDGSEKQNRRYCHLAMKKFNGRKGVEALIKIASKSDFHRKNLTSMRYIYYNGIKIAAEWKDQFDNPAVVKIK